MFFKGRFLFLRHNELILGRTSRFRFHIYFSSCRNMRKLFQGYLLTKTKIVFNCSQQSRCAKVPSLLLDRCYSRSFNTNKIFSKLKHERTVLRSNPICKENCRCLQTFNCLWTSHPEREEESNKISDKSLANDPETQKWLEEIRKDFENEEKTKTSISKHAETSVMNISDDDSLAPSLQKKYTVFKDEESREIPDEMEEDNQEVFSLYTERKDEFAGLNLERGIEGVFDIHELVEILHKENLQDICAISVPPKLHYCDYLVIASAISERQLVATAEFLRKLYKKKKHKSDPQIAIEGKQCRSWQALDIGNIVLHLFMPEERSKYDLETLWSVGSQYDDLSQQPVSEILLELEKHSTLFTLNDMKPIEQRPSH